MNEKSRWFALNMVRIFFYGGKGGRAVGTGLGDRGSGQSWRI